MYQFLYLLFGSIKILPSSSRIPDRSPDVQQSRHQENDKPTNNTQVEDKLVVDPRKQRKVQSPGAEKSKSRALFWWQTCKAHTGKSGKPLSSHFHEPGKEEET